MPFMLEADEAARRFAKAIEIGKSYSVIPWQMGIVAKLMRLLPNWPLRPPRRQGRAQAKKPPPLTCRFKLHSGARAHPARDLLQPRSNRLIPASAFPVIPCWRLGAIAFA